MLPRSRTCGLRGDQSCSSAVCGTFGVGSRHVNHHDIQRLIHIGGRRHTTAALLELAIIKTQAPGIVTGLRKRLQSRNDNLPRGKPMRKCISAIQLRRISVLSPNRNAKPTISQRHGRLR